MASMASFFALKATQGRKQDESKDTDDSMKKITAKRENDSTAVTRWSKMISHLSTYSTATAETVNQFPPTSVSRLLEKHN